jgi:hypothetical protein
LTRELSRTTSPKRPALVMYDCWTARDVRDAAPYRKLLSVLKLEAASRKLDLLVRYHQDQLAIRKELERQGFPPEYRIVRYSLFHWLRWTRFFRSKKTVADRALVVGTAGT